MSILLLGSEILDCFFCLVDEYKDAAIPLGGDQLVRVRVTGARDMVTDGRMRDGHRERIFPEIIEFFHVQQDFLDVCIQWICCII